MLFLYWKSTTSVNYYIYWIVSNDNLDSSTLVKSHLNFIIVLKRHQKHPVSAYTHLVQRTVFLAVIYCRFCIIYFCINLKGKLEIPEVYRAYIATKSISRYSRHPSSHSRISKIYVIHETRQRDAKKQKKYKVKKGGRRGRKIKRIISHSWKNVAEQNCKEK